jgi:hypothetical protein
LGDWLSNTTPPLVTVAEISYPRRFDVRVEENGYRLHRVGAFAGPETRNWDIAPEGGVLGAWVSTAASDAGTTDQRTSEANVDGVVVALNNTSFSSGKDVKEPVEPYGVVGFCP